MSKTTSRPFVPVGSYDTKARASNACVVLNREKPDQHWEPCPSPKNAERYAIVRKK